MFEENLPETTEEPETKLSQGMKDKVRLKVAKWMIARGCSLAEVCQKTGFFDADIKCMLD
jgi:hypothetical protein